MMKIKKIISRKKVKILADTPKERKKEEQEYLTTREYIAQCYQEILALIIALKMTKQIYAVIKKLFFVKSVMMFQMENKETYRILIDEDGDPKLEKIESEDIKCELINTQDWQDLIGLLCFKLKEGYARRIAEHSIDYFCTGNISESKKKTKKAIMATKYWKSLKLSIKDTWR